MLNHPTIYFLVGFALGLLFLQIEYTEKNIASNNLILKSLAEQTAQHYQIDVNLLFSIVAQESNWKPDAISPKGAIGLMQIMPATGWAQCGLTENQLFEPQLNLNCGVSYFVKLLRRFKSIKLALCAYNSGETRVARLGRCPNIQETVEYSRNILINWKQ